MIWYERACKLAGRYMPWAAQGQVRDEFYDYLRFTGLEVDAKDALALTYGTTIFSTLFLLLATLLFGLANLPWFPLLFAALLVPLLLFYYLGNYPKSYAEIYRVKVLGSMPDLVSNLALSLKVNPNLENALDFAAKRTKGPVGEELKRMLWYTYMRIHTSAERALLKFAEEWKSWNEDFSRSIYYLTGSMMEKKEDKRISMIDKGVETILAGTSKKMDLFAASLESPTVLLYFSGILLPLILIALLPTLSYVGTSIGAWEIFIAYCIALPLGVYMWSKSILNKRPITILAPEIPDQHPGFPPKGKMLIRGKALPAVPLFLLITMGISIPGLIAPRDYWLDPSILVIWGLALGISLYLWGTTRHKAVLKGEIEEAEDGFIDALSQLGNRLSEGRPLEDAFAHVGRVMGTSKVGLLFTGVADNIAMARKNLRSALFDREEGALRFVYSDLIWSVMEVVVESSQKGSEAAAAAVLRIARHLETLKQIEAKLQEKLDSTVESMQTTVMYFAPFIAGVVVVLQDLMNKQLLKSREAAGFASFNPGSLETPLSLDISSAPGIAGILGQETATKSIPMGVLQLILGIYLLEMVVILTSYIEEIRSGDDEVNKRMAIAKNLLVASAIFTVSIVVAKSFLGLVS